MHLLDAPNEICLSWREKEVGGVKEAVFFLTGFLTASAVPLTV